MSLRTDLQAVRALLATEGSWTKDALARGVSGYRVSPTGRNAKAYCLVGAGMRIARKRNPGPIFDALRQQFSNPDADKVLLTFNDAPETTHANIIALIDGAIAALPEGE